MKQTIRLLLAALTIVLGLASCATNDLPVDPDVLVKEMSGMWWSLADQEGTYKDATDSYPYTRMGQAICFNEDGTGYGVTFFFNDEQGDPIAIIGGEGMCPFTYTVKGDGSIKMNFDNAYKEYADYFKKWTMSYANEAVTATNGTLTLTLEKPSDAMAQTIRDWDEQFNGGAAIGGSGFNPNDEDFTFDNWRNEPGIYLYDGTGEYTITQKGRTCKFSLVPLPWYEGTKLTNLPDHFCDGITPENGWELVLNLCGNTQGSIKNNNFFAVYNKYLGILRFFYYLPEGYSTGNDHVWEISMSDHLAQQALFGYGVPSDRTLNKAALGQSGDGSYYEYVTPWVKNMSNDGLVVPNVGWWAFDVDLSMYRDGNVNPNDIISLQMRSWNTTHTTLYSTILAGIDGTFSAKLKLDQVKTKSSSTTKGILMGLQAAAQAGSSIANFASHNWAGGLTSLGQMLGTGSSLAGLAGGSGSTSYTGGSLDGTISLGLDGNVNTDGVISGSAPTVGIASPTIYMKDFDTKNSHLGQGVWGIKTAPVVYWTDKLFPWDIWNSDPAHNFEERYDYYCFSPYFFDPSSIEIELNPNIFPNSEIEWIEVDAICGARGDRQPISGELNALRSAYGVNATSPRKYCSDGGLDRPCESTTIWGQNDCLWDFWYNSSDKYGLNALNTIYTSKQRSSDGWYGAMHYWNDKIQGRGIDGYAIEPQVKGSENYGYDDLGSYLPFLEVNVKVLVKMKGMQQPIVLSRNYLPEIKEWGLGADFAASAKKTRPYASKMNGHTDLYDYQMKRISDIIVRYELSEASEIPLSKVTSDYVAKDGDVLTGTLGKNVKISIADGATVTLKDATINGVNSDSYRWAGITCEGDATIILKGNNTVKGFHWAFPGISVPTGKTLTIYGSGSLNVSSGGCASGIGAGYTSELHCGNIVIAGGSIAATGGQQAAGIGGGYFSNCGSITITSGVTSVTATKGMSAPNSIGAGYRSSCGTVTIGGKVTGNITESPYTYKP